MDFEFFSSEQRRSALLSLAPHASDARLGMLGLSPAAEPIFVTESAEDGIFVGTHQACVLASVRALGMTILEPTLRQGTSPDVYEVLADFGGTGFEAVAEAATEAEARAQAAGVVRNLVGETAMSFADWLAMQRSDPFFDGDSTQGSDTRKRRAAQWAYVVTVSLEGRARTDGWMAWKLLVPQGGDKVRLKAAREVLSQNGSLRRTTRGKSVVRYGLRAVLLGDKLYANYHDLVRAARAGIETEGLIAWPGIGANEFVVDRELHRHLTAQGWRRLWHGECAEDFARTRVAGGAIWVREVSRRALKRLASHRLGTPIGIRARG